jgi:hypothetical protein
MYLYSHYLHKHPQAYLREPPSLFRSEREAWLPARRGYPRGVATRAPFGTTLPKLTYKYTKEHMSAAYGRKALSTSAMGRFLCAW